MCFVSQIVDFILGDCYKDKSYRDTYCDASCAIHFWWL